MEECSPVLQSQLSPRRRRADAARSRRGALAGQWRNAAPTPLRAVFHAFPSRTHIPYADPLGIVLNELESLSTGLSAGPRPALHDSGPLRPARNGSME